MMWLTLMHWEWLILAIKTHLLVGRRENSISVMSGYKSTFSKSITSLFKCLWVYLSNLSRWIWVRAYSCNMCFQQQVAWISQYALTNWTQERSWKTLQSCRGGAEPSKDAWKKKSTWRLKYRQSQCFYRWFLINICLKLFITDTAHST